MPWQQLSDIKEENIKDLPLILAGPILRRTEPLSVTVWVVLKEKRSVVLTVHDISGQLLMSGTRDTIELGKYLHVVAVTAINTEATKMLQPGNIYKYNLEFGDAKDLASVGILNPTGTITDITYGNFDLPTFCLPPADLNNVRIIHGSCRKPHGPSSDALEALDGIINTSAKEPNQRPHQLFLTGDQIYADDVADLLLKLLTVIGDILLSWPQKEELPAIKKKAEELQPRSRRPIVLGDCGFTSDDCVSHLFSFGEFSAMYLMVWSDILWPKDLPTFKDVFGREPSISKRVLRSGDIFELEEPALKDYKIQLGNIEIFRKSISKIKRALANITTYMILDDHEITDDWYLNRKWVQRVLGKEMGKRVIQNGLLAYAIFQGWGNTPNQFDTGADGANLLLAAQQWKGSDKPSETSILRYLGLEPDPFLDPPKNTEIFHREHVLDWHYTVNEQSYQVIVLDSRTWRSFLNGNINPPGIISKKGLDKQFQNISPQPPFYLTLVVCQTPLIGVPITELIQELGRRWPAVDPEEWSLEDPPNSYQYLLATLAISTPVSSENANVARIVLLSGDVHYGFAARLQYEAKRPYTLAASEKPALMVAAQLTSSSFKNESGLTKKLHTMGYTIVKTLPAPMVWAGWNNPQGEQGIKIGTSTARSIDSTLFYERQMPWYIRKQPALVLLSSLPPDSEINVEPDWRYRIDFIKAENVARSPSPFTPLAVPAPPPGDRKYALKSYLAMSSNYQQYTKEWGNGKEIVGLNNIGEVTFSSSGDDDLKVIQQLWWRLEKRGDIATELQPFPLTKYIISLNALDNLDPIPGNRQTEKSVDNTIIDEIATKPRLQESYLKLVADGWQIFRKNIFFGNSDIDSDKKLLFIDDDDKDISIILSWIEESVKWAYRKNDDYRRMAIKEKATGIFGSSGITDFEKMASVYEWSGWFWDYILGYNEVAFMADMTLTFTERSDNLRSVSDRKYQISAPGVTSSSSTGFKRMFRDASPQLRHATMSINASLLYGDFGLYLLQIRELIDIAGGVPQPADIRLNKKCNEIAWQLRSNNYDNKRLSEFGSILRQQLGDPNETQPWTGPPGGDPDS